MLKKPATLAALVRFTEFSFTSANRECIGWKGMWQEKLKTINFFEFFPFSSLLGNYYFLVQNVDIVNRWAISTKGHKFQLEITENSR